MVSVSELTHLQSVSIKAACRVCRLLIDGMQKKIGSQILGMGLMMQKHLTRQPRSPCCIVALSTITKSLVFTSFRCCSFFPSGIVESLWQCISRIQDWWSESSMLTRTIQYGVFLCFSFHQHANTIIICLYTVKEFANNNQNRVTVTTQPFSCDTLTEN